MGITDDFVLDRSFSFADELRLVHVAIEPRDRSVFEARAIERYRWFLRATLELTTGELRRAWGSGSSEDGALVENLPNLSLCVPVSELPQRVFVRVEGKLEIDDETVVFDQRTAANQADIMATDVPLADLPSTIGKAAPVTRSIDVPEGAHLVATLPAIGLLEYVRPTYRLHTPNGSFALAGLDTMIDGLPGREVRRTHAGGARGRLAIYSAREDPSVEHVVLVEVHANGAFRVIHRSSSIANERGCFDQTGTLYLGWSTPAVTELDHNVTSIGRSTVVFDTDAVQLVPGWTGPLTSDGSRYHIDAERISVLHHGRVSTAPRGQAATSAPPFTWNHGWASAHHPVPDVSACLADDSVHVFHPQRGTTQIAVGGEAIAVLRDGRVVVVGDRLFVIDIDGRTVDLGAVGQCGPRLEITEGDVTTLWTLDPAHWSIELPCDS